MHPAAGSWRRWCRSWPTYATWTPPVASVDHYHALWEQAVRRAAQCGRHLLLVVDGLDEDLHPPGSPSVASLLPTLVDTHAHVLVTSRPRPELPG